MACIYIIKNTINSKVYIGQTTNTAEKRFKKHLSMIYSNGCSALYPAFKKYGIENFKVETLIEGEFDLQTLNELEKTYIKHFNSLSPNGYNLTTGGDKYEYCKETSIKKSNATKGRKMTWADKTSLGIKSLWENKEYREKILAARGKRGKYKEQVKPLRIALPMEEINEMYKNGMNINQIAKYFNVPHSTIKRRINIET